MDLDRTLLERRVTRLLLPWKNKAGPGVTLGIVQNGHLVLHRSAGLASVEQDVPIGPETRFRIASVSKQFTCAAVLMLDQEGRLRLDDPVTRHLTDLPEQGVTVEHLMHNTSGIRDMLEILRQGGADLGTPVSTEALTDGIRRQRRLNFAPGTRFLYSNSNFLLLGLIVERLTGETLAAFLERRIFAPLGMSATQHTPDVSVAIPGLATGYLPHPAGWMRAPHALPLGGEGGLVSSVTDLALWDRNLNTGRVGGDWLAPALARQTPFLNGTENRYARGQIVRDYRGHGTISHGGLWPGFKTEFLRVPVLDTTVIAIANAGNADPGLLAQQVLDVLLEAVPGTEPLVPVPPPAVLASLAGRYLDRDTGATLDIGINAGGQPTLATNGLVVTATPLPDNLLASPRSSSVFAVQAQGTDAVEVEQDAGHRSVWHRVKPGATLPDGLAGTYRSDEMAARWTVGISHGIAVVDVQGPVVAGGPWTVEPVEDDVFRVLVPGTLFQAWLDVRVLRDDAGITGLDVSGARARHVRYLRDPA